jgi:hypothetical protein
MIADDSDILLVGVMAEFGSFLSTSAAKSA